VTALAALGDGPGTIYVYAETAPSASGGTEHALSVLRVRPDRRPVYRRLRSSAIACDALQAHIADGELRVVAAYGDGIILVQLPLAGW